MILRLTSESGKVETHQLDGDYDLAELNADINQALEMGSPVNVLLGNHEILPFDPPKYRKISVLVDLGDSP